MGRVEVRVEGVFVWRRVGQDKYTWYWTRTVSHKLREGLQVKLWFANLDDGNKQL